MEGNINKPPGVTPGWNDPPILSYDPKNSANKPSRLSNKRVAFPQSNNANSSNMYPGTVPPINSGPMFSQTAPMTTFPPNPQQPQAYNISPNNVVNDSTDSKLVLGD